MPREDCAWPGFIGVELYAAQIGMPTDEPTVIVSGSSGNLRRNDKGELLGDAIFAMYPETNLAMGRDLAYLLNDPQYTQSPDSA